MLIKSLSRQLTSFDDIYGLDDEHRDLLRYSETKFKPSDSKFESKQLTYFASYMGTFPNAISTDSVKDLLKVMYGNILEIEAVKIGVISGELKSLRIDVSSGYPFFLLKELFLDFVKLFCSTYDVDDFTLSKFK